MLPCHWSVYKTHYISLIIYIYLRLIWFPKAWPFIQGEFVISNRMWFKEFTLKCLSFQTSITDNPQPWVKHHPLTFLFGNENFLCFSSAQFSHSVLSGSLCPRSLQHARLPCPSPTPGARSNSCPSSRWCRPTISSSVVPFSSCLDGLEVTHTYTGILLLGTFSQSRITEIRTELKRLF